MKSLKKSAAHFLKLLRRGEFSSIVRISKYYLMDQGIRRILIGGIVLSGKLFPPEEPKQCPACGRSFPAFFPVVSGERFAFGVQCPYCKSYERHRSQWLYYERKTGLLHPRRRIAVLHCAPEQLFFEHFESEEHVDYYPVDKWSGYRVCGKPMRDYVDLTRLPYQDEQFDYILCNHVLEHIQDDRTALSELRRTLKPEGTAFLNVPLDETLKQTLENPAYNTDALRLKHYGQCDHVRRYGLDYEARLKEAGFWVDCVIVGAFFSKEETERYGLLPEERLYICKKGREPVEAGEDSWEAEPAPAPRRLWLAGADF